ncbi:tigger transposable element-derived protein 1-like [Palaemon carinicauda]|uniref:tigger transposable element-derived protein 1-like n=1 Tax=Palaemon carinicauda TaxID=392227 RepID=UPI0035B6A3D1
MKDRLTMAFCANASMDLKIKPPKVYSSKNPRAFKAQNIMKDRLLVFWRSNAKSWVTWTIFIEWVNVCFGPAIKNFLEENNLPLKCLLVLDNAPAHPPILEKGDFDIVPCLKKIDKAWNEILRRTLNSSWKKLWPDVVAKRDFEGFEHSPEDEAIDDPAPEGDVEDVISIRRSMGIVIDEADVDKLMDVYREELTTEDMKELKAMQMTNMQEEQHSI